MGIVDWLGRARDPVLQHLIDAYQLRGGAGGTLEGRLRGLRLGTFGKQTFAKGINVELGDCAGEAAFGFFRPDDADLRQAVEFGADGMERWQRGEGVRLAGFFIDCEGEAHWLPFLGRHATDVADYLALYSPALSWAYFHPPGLVVRLVAPATGEKAAPDLPAIDRDLAASARLLEFLRDAAAKQGLAP